MSSTVLTAVVLAALAAAPGPAGEAGKPEAPRETPDDAAKTTAEVTKLVKQLGHEEWARREEAKKLTVKVRPVDENAKTAVHTARDRAEFRKRYPEVYRKYLASDEERAGDAGAKPDKPADGEGPRPGPDAKPPDRPAEPDSGK